MSEADLTAQLDRLPFVPDGLVAFRRYLGWVAEDQDSDEPVPVVVLGGRVEDACN
jgi:hypothetical protein